MRIGLLLALSLGLNAQTYDLLLKGGHVIDPKNNVSQVMDVAVSGGKIARVAANIPAAQAKTVADVAGLYVTPGLIDIHTHVQRDTGDVVGAAVELYLAGRVLFPLRRHDDGGCGNVRCVELSGLL